MSMLKKIIFVFMVLFATKVYATAADFAPYFKVDMGAEVPDLEEYMDKLNSKLQYYNKGYISRFEMDKTFNKEFSRTIKFYGLSEGRLKTFYEDELLDILNWLPKETYQYIGPMLHQVPGMPEKILNMPGIKETKNQFPKDVAERFKAMENIEYLSPALYFLLMPRIWDENKPINPDKPQKIQVHKPRINPELPDFLKEKIGAPVKTAEKKQGTAEKKVVAARPLNIRTIHPSLTTPLTSKDILAFISTIDMVIEWGMKDDMSNYGKLINGEALLDIWEKEQGTALNQNDLKDAVNPCQRLVLKTRFSGLYTDFAYVVAQKGFTPEEWAYTCDRTIKAFRIAEANMSIAYAIRYHRRGYYDQYINRLPKRWQDEMYSASEALIKMYTALQEDVDAVRPHRKELEDKFTEIHQIMLTAPIIY